MMTVEDIFEYFNKAIAEDFLRADKLGLKRVQTAAGVLMVAAQEAGDKETMQRFRIVAAHAANKQEELGEE
jgi:hypothetical protein